jgi:hypothetical protein
MCVDFVTSEAIHHGSCHRAFVLMRTSSASTRDYYCEASCYALVVLLVVVLLVDLKIEEVMALEKMCDKLEEADIKILSAIHFARYKNSAQYHAFISFMHIYIQVIQWKTFMSTDMKPEEWG